MVSGVTPFSAKILDGRKLAEKLRGVLQDRITAYRMQGQAAPGLAVILVGEDAASRLYVQNKQRACRQVGITVEAYTLAETTTTAELLQLISELNVKPTIDGILVQLPLPEQIETATVLDHISPEKDVDGFHPENLGRLAQQRPWLRPCTPAGVMLLLAEYGIPLQGLEATVIGVSNIVGRPMIFELLMAGCTVTACHRATRDLQAHVERADILVAAAGQPQLIPGAWIKPGAIVIDIGINHLPNGQFVGDVEFEAARHRAAWLTPVPGGVGPMTVAVLLQNTLLAYEANANMRPMPIGRK